MNETMYMISESELKDLLTSHYTLKALNRGGVNNWEWHGESIGNFIEGWLRSMEATFGCDMSDSADDFTIEDIAEYELGEYDEVI